MQFKNVNKKHTDQYSIVQGRSMCTSCQHELAWYDLLPIVSWVSLKGECRYCKAKIGVQYPVVEFATSLSFVLSYIYWPNALQGLNIVIFVLYLIFITCLMAMLVYDIKFMILPNKMLIAAVFPVISLVILRIIFSSTKVDETLSTIFGVLAFGGLFYVLFQYSQGKWIGGGDVKLGFLLGAFLGSPRLSLFAIFVASLIGLVTIVLLSTHKKIGLSTKVPFGPMLILGAVLTFFLDSEIMVLYQAMIIEV